MIFDANLIFDSAVSLANGMQGVNVFTNGGSQVSSNVLDMLYQRDLGQGSSGPATLDLVLLVTTAFAGGTSLNVQLQGSTDNVTYTTYSQSGAIPIAALGLGAKIFRSMVAAAQPEAGPAPRYYRLNYLCAGAMTAGAVIAAIASGDDVHYYRPGIAVAN